MERPKGILFDFGGTLVGEPPFDPLAGTRALLEAAVESGGASAEQVQAEAKRFRDSIWPAVEREHIDFPASSFNRLIYERFGVRWEIPRIERELIFWKAAFPRFPPEPGVHAMLDRIDLAKGVVSNFSSCEEVLRWELEQAGLADRFEFLMVSSEYGVRKPHPELFKTAAAKLGLHPEDIWFCGDRIEKDIAGALAAGMVAVWYNPDDQTLHGPRPDYVIRHWDELGFV